MEDIDIEILNVHEDYEEKEFDIIPVQDEKTKVYSIKNYEELFKRVENWTKENSPIGKINSQEDYDFYLKDKPKNKESALSQRVVAKNIKDLVSSVRKGIIKSTMGTFEDQAKSIEKMLDAYDKECKEEHRIPMPENLSDEEKEKWLEKTQNKTKKPTLIKLEIKSYDEKVIEKIKNYALKLGAEVK